jgi:hypothetical protein
MFQVYVPNVLCVLDICYKSRLDVAYTRMLQSVCFKCFIRMLQVFYLDVAYICNVSICVFLVFQKYVTSASTVSDVCCKGFIWILQK